MTPAAIGNPGPREVERVMEELVYEHLIDLVDFDRMFTLEQILLEQLERLFDKGQLAVDVREDDLTDRAGSIFARAWHRVLEDPRRFVDFRGTWTPDDDCELCRALARTETAS